MEGQPQAYSDAEAVSAIEEIRYREEERVTKELYAAWMSDYDFLYFIYNLDYYTIAHVEPSNDGELKHYGYWSERFDLRDEKLTPADRQKLEEYTP